MLGETVARLQVEIGANLKGLNKSLKGAEGSLKKFGKSMSKVGNTLTVGLTAPLAAFSALAIKNWDKQEKAVAKVEAGLKSMGTIGVGSLEDLKQKASELQKTSLFGDEEILDGVTAQLLTFGNIAGEQFDRAQQASLDLASKLNTDLKSAAIQVGKALNDPTTGLTMLTRVGITFTEEQKNLIKSLNGAGRAAEAQNVILKELERQFGGTAAAAASAGTGPMKQFQNRLGDVTEKIGGALIPALNRLMGVLEDLLDWFEAIKDSDKKYFGWAFVLAASAGPLAKMAGWLAAIAGALAKIGAAAGGIAAIGALAAYFAPRAVVGGIKYQRPLAPSVPFNDSTFVGPINQLPDLGDGPAPLVPPKKDPAPAAWAANIQKVEKAALASLHTFKGMKEPLQSLRQTSEVVSESWEYFSQHLSDINYRVRTLGTEMRTGLSDTLGEALGQLATLQTGFSGFLEMIVQGLRQQLAMMIAVIAKQKILNALKAQESTISNSGGLGGVLGALGLGAMNPILGAGLAVGALALASGALGRRGKSNRGVNVNLKGTTVASGDIHFSAAAHGARLARLGA